MPELTPEQIAETLRRMQDLLDYLDSIPINEIAAHISLGTERFKAFYISFR